MGLLAAHDGADKDDEISDPDNGEPDVDVPFRFGVFLRLGDTEQVAGCRQYDEQLVSPEDEPAKISAEQPCLGGPLHDIETGADQCIAAKGENNGGSVQGTQPAEIEPGFYVEFGKCQLRRDDHADEKADNPPEQSGDRAVTHDLIHVPLGCGLAGRHRFHFAHQENGTRRQHEEQDPGMCLEQTVLCEGGSQQREECRHCQQYCFCQISHRMPLEKMNGLNELPTAMRAN